MGLNVFFSVGACNMQCISISLGGCVFSRQTGLDKGAAFEWTESCEASHMFALFWVCALQPSLHKQKGVVDVAAWSISFWRLVWLPMNIPGSSVFDGFDVCLAGSSKVKGQDLLSWVVLMSCCESHVCLEHCNHNDWRKPTSCKFLWIVMLCEYATGCMISQTRFKQRFVWIT